MGAVSAPWALVIVGSLLPAGSRLSSMWRLEPSHGFGLRFLPVWDRGLCSSPSLGSPAGCPCTRPAPISGVATLKTVGSRRGPPAKRISSIAL